jgi:hypothetical protein
MSYSNDEVSRVVKTMDKYRANDQGEVGAALVVVGLSAERAAKEKQMRDDMIVVAHRTGASIRQLADATGLDRKTITGIVTPANQDRG